MTLKEYATHLEVEEKSELEKIIYIFFYHVKEHDKKSFTINDVNDWFSALDYSLPNASRLRKKMIVSPVFIKDGNNGFKLHAKNFKKLEEETGALFYSPKRAIKTNSKFYVNPDRIIELKSILHKDYDLTKVYQICYEMNIAHGNDSMLSMIYLTRALIDHVPPIFGCKSFDEVANNYAGTKSFKDAMKNLNETSRKIADQHLHTHIRKKEVLPNITQADFSNNIDVLLSEIVRLLK